eukprot:GHRQ01000180.1.p1 GENE.GHRQ01000180.1~~GHRQ01000180.1.p1  ORF type:complete len:309 (+),score=87.76 GHRQ01000180.1:165-1091(+)
MMLTGRINSSACRPAGAARKAKISKPRRAVIVAFKGDEQKDPSIEQQARKTLEKLLKRNKHKLRDENGTDPTLDSLPKDVSSSSSSSTKADAPVVVPPPKQGKGWLGGPAAFEASLSVPVFSRRREVFVGRAAMAGYYASCMWEATLMGPGPLSQLSILSGLPPVIVQGVVAAFILHGAWGLLPITPTWSAPNREDMQRRPVGPPRKFVNPISNPQGALGFSEWGFTKANELFAGRIAMLGFMGTCMVEPIAGGKGALSQIAWWLHLPVSSSYYQLARWVLIATPFAFGVLAYVKRRPGQLRGGDDIY